MKQDLRNSGNRSSEIFSRLAAEKRKTVVAVYLIAVMVFVLVGVPGKKVPQSANAAVAAREITAGQMNSKLKISFIELPKVEGRNDVLTRDFFAADDWRDFVKGGKGKSVGEEVGVVSRNSGEETARQVAEELKLETIVLSENPRAFVNDKLLSAGDKLFIGDGINTYECEVSEIEGNTVFIKCGEQDVEDLRFTSGD